jgi:hypothetical protein
MNKLNVQNFEALLNQVLAAEVEPADMSSEEFDLVSGGANCSYLGVQDYKLMQSYESRNYSC